MIYVTELSRGASTVSVLFAVEYRRDVEVVGMMDDVQDSWHCVGKQQSKLVLPVSGLLSTLSSDSSMVTIRASQYLPVTVDH